MALLVAGYGACRKNDDVSLVERDVPMIVDGDPRQGSHRLALGAGGEAEHLARPIVLGLAVADLDTGGDT